MIGFDLKKCPMCGGNLSVRMPMAGSFKKIKRYICSTHLPETKISHYHISSSASGLIQIIQAPPFFIYNKFGSDKSEIYHFKNNEFPLILTIPTIPIANKSSEELANRIKILILFS